MKSRSLLSLGVFRAAIMAACVSTIPMRRIVIEESPVLTPEEKEKQLKFIQEAENEAKQKRERKALKKQQLTMVKSAV